MGIRMGISYQSYDPSQLGGPFTIKAKPEVLLEAGSTETMAFVAKYGGLSLLGDGWYTYLELFVPQLSVVRMVVKDEQ